MFTQEDLRATLTALEADAPSAAAVRDHVLTVTQGGVVPLRDRSSGRRPWLAGLVAAATVVVVAGGAAIAVSRLHDRSAPVGSRPADTTSPLPVAHHLGGVSLQFSYRLSAPAAGFAIQQREIYDGRQVVVFDDTRHYNGSPAGVADAVRAVVYPVGGYDASAAQAGTPITVNGRAGYFARVPALVRDSAGSEVTASVPAVVWQYAPNAWVEVNGMTSAYQTRATESDIASTVLAGQPEILRVPYSLSVPPVGVVRASATDFYVNGRTMSEVDYVRTGRSTAAVDPDFTIHANVNDTPVVATDQDGNTPFHVGAGDTAVTINGHSGVLSKPQGWDLWINFGRYTVELSATSTMSSDQLLAIARGITMSANADDESAWFDARNALP